MHRNSPIAVLLLGLAALLLFQSGAARAETVEYRGADVWNGEAFERLDLFVSEGLFVAAVHPDRIVDLSGVFVVPAYANAHAHLTNADGQSSNYFLENGVFYVWNPGSVPLFQADHDFYARPETYDVRFAYGAITEPGGHPERLYVDILTNYAFPGKDRAWFLGRAFHYGTSREEIDAALDLLVSQRADFVKAMLLFSEEYAQRRGDPDFYGMKGLNPENVQYLVAQANRRGLRTAFHVETVEDLLIASRAGAFMAAHLPGYGYKSPGEDLALFTLSTGDAAEIAASGMLLVPTYSVAEASYRADPDPHPRSIALHQAAQASNLRLLDRAGAQFAIGTDQEGEIFTEVEYLASLEVFETQRLLQITFGTGAKLFSDRRIGCFEVGCEADFLVLQADPLVDVSALRKIKLRVKAGHKIERPDLGTAATNLNLPPPHYHM